MTAEAGRRGLLVMIAVPILAPCRHLQRTQPPDVLAGIYAFRQSRLEMQQAIHEALHVQTIGQSNRTDPKESDPAKQEITEAKRNYDERGLKFCPDHVS